MACDIIQCEEFFPLVSIVIPVYNGGKYLRQAIDSALNQSYHNIEVLVVNDGSADEGETERIALSYGDQIRYFSKENGGVSSALNYGIANMRGDYFSWLSHDDVYQPDKVKKQIDALSLLEDKNTVIKCETCFIDEHSRYINRDVHKRKIEYNREVKWNEALMGLFRDGNFNGCSLLIPKKIFEKCGSFDEKLRFNQDGLMWIKIFLSGFSVCFIRYAGVKSRIHSEQLTRTKTDLYHSDCLAMSDFLIPSLMKITTSKERFLYAYAVDSAKHNSVEVVKRIWRNSNHDKLNVFERLALRFYLVFGRLRSYIRKLYYRVFMRIRMSGD